VKNKSEQMNKPRVLIISDRYPMRKNLINQGDVALSIGLNKLLTETCSWEVISGGWKNFPDFNFRNFNGKEPIEEVFIGEYQKMLQRAS
jgi:hypothetical protein